MTDGIVEQGSDLPVDSSMSEVHPSPSDARSDRAKAPQSVLDVDEDLLKRLESVLFAAGKKVPIEDIAKMCNKKDSVPLIEAGLKKLKERYASADSSLMVIQDGGAWKLTVKEQFMPFVRKIVTQTELKKSVMETLAVISYKNPIIQSELIKIRTNKAYDHLDLLEEEGYITRKKKGRTKEITLAPKFFEYFDLPEDALHEKFKSVQELESQVEQAEFALKAKKAEIQKGKETQKAMEEAHKAASQAKMEALDKSIESHPVIEILDDKGLPHELDTYDEPVEVSDEPVKSDVKIIHNRLGELDIVSTKPKVEIVGGKVVALGEMQVEEPSVPIKGEPGAQVEAAGAPEEEGSSEVDRRVAEILGGAGDVESEEVSEGGPDPNSELIVEEPSPAEPGEDVQPGSSSKEGDSPSAGSKEEKSR